MIIIADDSQPPAELLPSPPSQPSLRIPASTPASSASVPPATMTAAAATAAAASASHTPATPADRSGTSTHSLGHVPNYTLDPQAVLPTLGQLHATQQTPLALPRTSRVQCHPRPKFESRLEIDAFGVTGFFECFCADLGRSVFSLARLSLFRLPFALSVFCLRWGFPRKKAFRSLPE